MSDSESETTPNNNRPITLSAEQFAEFMRLNGSQKTSNHQTSSLESLGEVRLTDKLNGDNYTLWVKLMRRAIGGKGLASHISGVTEPPPPTDLNFDRWQQRDDCCFNWIISNIDASLVNEVSQYATALDLWEGLATTYGSGADQFQISDLHRQTYNLKQGNLSLESLWQKLQDLWISIDTRDPNSMDTPSSIEKYNQHTQRHRLYQFVWALDDQYEKIKREILNMDPIPTARKAYGMVRREVVNTKLMNPEPPKESGIGVGLAVLDRSRPPPNQNYPPQRVQNYRKDEDKNKLVCSYCGGKKHTKDTCFHIHGFPEWWEEMKKARQARNPSRNNGGSRASAAVAVDRATYAEKPAGGVGPPGTGRGENRGDEKPAIASASVARTWSEGNPSAILTTGGEKTASLDSEEGGARVSPNWGAAARVPQSEDISLNTPYFPKLQSEPPKSQKPNIKPHILSKPPHTFQKSRNQPLPPKLSLN